MNENIKNLLWTTLAVVIGLQLNTQVTKMMAKKAQTSAASEDEE